MAKTKALISFAVTAKLICVFVFAYAKSRFSHDAAQFYGSCSEKFSLPLGALSPSPPIKNFVVFFFVFFFIL